MFLAHAMVEMVDALKKAPHPPIQGGPVDVVRTRRSMKHYTVFDSDFDSIGTQDLGFSVCLALSSFCFAFGLDIFKDTQLAENVPPETKVVLSYIQPALLVFAILFGVGAALFWLRKRSTIQKIKDDCKVVEVEDERPR